MQEEHTAVTFQKVSIEGPLILARGGDHTGRKIGKCAEQSHDRLGGQPAEQTSRSPLRSGIREQGAHTDMTS